METKTETEAREKITLSREDTHAALIIASGLRGNHTLA